MLKQPYPGLGIYPGANMVQVNGLPWASGQDSEFAGANPPVHVGDIAAVPPVTKPDGFALQLSSTGVPVVFSAGATQRQSFTLDVYSNFYKQWYGQVTDYINDQAPSWDPTPHTFVFALNQPINPVLLTPFCPDPEGDTVTITLNSGALPAGISCTGNTLTGTPSVAGTYLVTFLATDSIGQGSPSPTWTLQVQNPVTPPPVVKVAPQVSGGQLDVYPGASALTLVGSFTADSTKITADGKASGFPQDGFTYTFTADGGLYRLTPEPTSALLAWKPIAGATGYNVYVNGVLNQQAIGLQAVVTGLQIASYDPATGVITPAGTYTFNVVGTNQGVELSSSEAVTITMQPSSVPLITPMKRLWPFPNTGLD